MLYQGSRIVLKFNEKCKLLVMVLTGQEETRG